MFSFVSGTTQIDLEPDYGYQAVINMALDIVEHGSGFSCNDNGSQYDSRVCKNLIIHADYTNTLALYNFLNDPETGRGNTITMILPSGSQFYPFGPDYGDSGDFTVVVTNKKFSGQLDNPFKWYKTELELLMVTHPAYSLPTLVPEGIFQFGNITGLNCPTIGFEPEYKYGLKTVYNFGQKYSSVDTKFIKKTTKFTLDCNNSNAAAILSMIASTTRGNSFESNIADVYKSLGISPNVLTNMPLKLTSNVLAVTHKRHDQFSIDLNFSNEA